jgi:hypothetical protein
MWSTLRLNQSNYLYDDDNVSCQRRTLKAFSKLNNEIETETGSFEPEIETGNEIGECHFAESTIYNREPLLYSRYCCSIWKHVYRRLFILGQQSYSYRRRQLFFFLGGGGRGQGAQPSGRMHTRQSVDWLWVHSEIRTHEFRRERCLLWRLLHRSLYLLHLSRAWFPYFSSYSFLLYIYINKLYVNLGFVHLYKYVVLSFRMCILASRDHTCIHPQVSKAKNKTEECRKSVENKEVGGGCGASHLVNEFACCSI